MNHNFQPSLKFIFKWEGGYSDDKDDPGGATNFGITWRTYRTWHQLRGWHWPGKKAMNTLTRETASAIYQDFYWNECRCTELPAGIDLAVFDCAVNQGPGRAVRFLQKAAGVKADGIIGRKTIAAVREKYPLRGFMVRRALHYSALKHFWKYKRGWMNRLFDCHAVAIKLGERDV